MKEYETIKTACHNCGKIITVLTPFYGCIFCADCMDAETIAYQADASEFKARAGI